MVSNSNGEVNMLDTNAKKAVMSFQDSTHAHTPATSVAWDPLDVRTQIFVYRRT